MQIQQDANILLFWFSRDKVQKRRNENASRQPTLLYARELDVGRMLPLSGVKINNRGVLNLMKPTPQVEGMKWENVHIDRRGETLYLIKIQCNSNWFKWMEDESCQKGATVVWIFFLKLFVHTSECHRAFMDRFLVWPSSLFGYCSSPSLKVCFHSPVSVNIVHC